MWDGISTRGFLSVEVLVVDSIGENSFNLSKKLFPLSSFLPALLARG